MRQMYQVQLTHRAERDLREAAEYLAYTLDAPTAALNLLEEAETTVRRIAEMPEAFSLVRDDMLASAGYRWAPIGSYMAFYVVDQEAKTATIERITHGRRDWRQLVGGRSEG